MTSNRYVIFGSSSAALSQRFQGKELIAPTDPHHARWGTGGRQRNHGILEPFGATYMHSPSTIFRGARDRISSTRDAACLFRYLRMPVLALRRENRDGEYCRARGVCFLRCIFVILLDWKENSWLLECREYVGRGRKLMNRKLRNGAAWANAMIKKMKMR